MFLWLKQDLKAGFFSVGLSSINCYHLVVPSDILGFYLNLVCLCFGMSLADASILY